MRKNMMKLFFASNICFYIKKRFISFLNLKEKVPEYIS